MRSQWSTIKPWIKRIVWAVLGLVVAIESYYIGQVVYYAYNPITTSSYIESERARLGKVRHYPVKLNQISNVMIRSAISAEDFHFPKHRGIEWNSTFQAFINNVFLDKSAPGGSTITQQTVKNLFLSHEKSYIRKGQEIILTLVMEATWSKGRIIETYLNIAEFGKGIFGVEAAARYYYGTHAANLQRWQSVWLAAILTNPKYYQKQTTPKLREQMWRIWRNLDNYEIRRINNQMK